jgi:hypothetical protein
MLPAALRCLRSLRLADLEVPFPDADSDEDESEETSPVPRRAFLFLILAAILFKRRVVEESSDE